LAALLEPRPAPELEERWAAFVQAHSRLLLHTARSVTKDKDDAMDAYVHVLECLRHEDCHRLRGFKDDGRAKFTTWLVVVARRLCLDFHRARYGRLSSDDASIDGATRRRLVDLVSDELDSSSIPDASTPAADGVLQQAELSALLAQVLDSLEPRKRLLLTLRFEDDESAPRIARLLGYPTPFHVYRHLNAIMAELRKQLQDRGIEGPVP
jgi:RNA polymerase sigma factor (sigma-70 family)